MIAKLYPKAYKKYLSLPLFGSVLDDFSVWSHQRGYSIVTVGCQLKHALRIENFFREHNVKSLASLTHLLMLSSTLIDEIGYTPIEKREANLFFNLISETYEKASLIVSSNKSFDAWAEMMGDSVMTTALLDRLLHHARVFTLDGKSYRIQNKTKEE